MDCFYTLMTSPLGRLKLAASDRGLVAILWENEDPRRVQLGGLTQGSSTVLRQAERQLHEYFAGQRTTFTVAIDTMFGTPFQRSVWSALHTIPFGETRSYAQLARQIGRPTACRAVGAANGKNPLAIITPCHRAIGSDGSLTGFAGGLDAKRHLLALEAGRALPGGVGQPAPVRVA